VAAGQVRVVRVGELTRVSQAEDQKKVTNSRRKFQVLCVRSRELAETSSHRNTYT